MAVTYVGVNDIRHAIELFDCEAKKLGAVPSIYLPMDISTVLVLED